MGKDLLYANGKVVVKDRKQDLNAFSTMSLRNRKFESSCCGGFSFTVAFNICYVLTFYMQAYNASDIWLQLQQYPLLLIWLSSENLAFERPIR